MPFHSKILVVVELVLISFSVLAQSQDPSEDAVLLMTTLEPIDDEGSVILDKDGMHLLEDDEDDRPCSNITHCGICKALGCDWVDCEDSSNSSKPHCAQSTSVECKPVKCHQNDTCEEIDSCEACAAKNCSWINCGPSGTPLCFSEVVETCILASCNSSVTTIAPDTNTTTTAAPTTTSAPTTTALPTTTDIPDTNTTTTTSPNSNATTTMNPDNTTTTPNPETTTEVPTVPTTISPTTVPTTTSATTTTAAPAPASGGFSAGSFFGGITLTLALLAVGFGGYKFYKTRYDVNYRTL
ncbi:integumentary mucin A.1 [Hyalella azteca]|uniref:Integumentary mucin A.1 n=1 Tax=Hyalella azteca TaxID=294128 RepID=A0A8B7N113_HYAAZ|nr:integumentary mucin A.1 [Hyalella azteca]